ncbi:DUF4906 domain-containing protein [Bacteroides sp.]|uniref:DUF4906 domain-containing protein n=1 Tax=Bacteroides sp. TaxID=29523 RepID=UPI0025BC6178|nr:DUF4906 domain-containing protein [Bacteroides sp.]
MASCYKDDFGITPEIDGEGMSLTFQSDKLLPYQVTSRASDPKLEAEKRINNLHVFFFDEKGEYLRGKYLTGYNTENVTGGYYSPSQGVSILKIDHSPEAFNNPLYAAKARVIALANVYDGFFETLDESFCPKNIKNLTDLISKPYKPKELTLDIPPSGMPMYGDTILNLTRTDINSFIIPMRALMARVDLKFSIDSEHTDESKQLPCLQMAEWTVCNRPLSVPFVEPSGNSASLGDDKDDKMVKNSSVIYNRNGELNLSFYMFENKRGIVDDTNFKYPSGGDFTDDDKQKYKPQLCDSLTDGGKDATYVKLHCYYSTYNETGSGSSTYDVTYKLYLGKNHTNDFNIERNKQYKNNVTIKGITATDNNGEYNVTLDTRVHIEDSNPFYVSILRERNHDAHFCVTPMDIYMFDDTGENDNVKMKVSVENPSVNKWLRLEKVTAQQMQAGAAPNDKCYASGDEFRSGNGKRLYFTTTLMNELPSEVTLATSRDRVYIYIDENLVLSRRDANLILEYTGKDGKTVTSNLAIGQLPLIKINDGNGDIIYMEQIEEYLNHYDPLDDFDDQQLYSGLPWGTDEHFETLHWKAYGIYNAICDPELIRYNGYEYSGYMIQTMGQDVLKLYEIPLSALQYCHNRNKRKEDGTVPYLAEKQWYETWWHITENKTKWFLPGITEMEKALTQQYNVFPEFQNNFYWSCSVSEREGQTSGQDETRARATKILPNGSYIESGGQKPEYPASGRAKRTEKLRIRAFRIDLSPADY